MRWGRAKGDWHEVTIYTSSTTSQASSSLRMRGRDTEVAAWLREQADLLDPPRQDGTDRVQALL